MAQAKMRDLIINTIKREAAERESFVAFSDREIHAFIQKHFKKSPSLSAVSQSRNLMVKAGIVVQVDKVGAEKLWTLTELTKQKVEEPVRDEKPDTIEKTSTEQTLNEYTVDDVIHTVDKLGLVIDAMLAEQKQQRELLNSLMKNHQAVANHNLMVSRLDGITKVLSSIVDSINTKYLQQKQLIHGGLDDLNNQQIKVYEQMQTVEKTWAKVMEKADNITKTVMEAYKDGMSEGVRTMVILNDELVDKKNQEKIDTLTKIISGPRNGA